MAKIRRKLPPKHILVPDTEVLWHDEKDVAVSPNFTAFWEEYGDRYEIELAIPSVVFGELVYQHTTSALKALERANHQFDRLSAIANNNYKHKIGEGKVRRDVEKKLRNWSTSIGATIVETPVDSIDWSELIDSALWRKPPFLEDKKTEKGFRDSLILETVCDISKGSPDPNVVFISGDTLLIQGCDRKRTDGAQFATHESITGFSSFLRLLDEELTKDFVTSIQARARTKFHSDGDDSCLVYREDLISKIREDHADDLNNPDNDGNVGGLLTAALTIPTGSKWAPVSEERVWIVTPSFIRIDGKHDFVWESQILFVRLYEFTGRTTGLLSPIARERRLLRVSFDIVWTARVDSSGRFRRMTVNSVELDAKTFKAPSSDEIRRYMLDGPEVATA